MTKLPYLPMFVDDFFGGTLRWDGEKQAVYALLLMHQWASGPLPKTANEIAEAIHYEPQRFRKLWESVQRKFSMTEEGWINRRLEEVRAHANEIAGERSKAGKAGAAAKAKLKQKAAEAKAIEQANAEAIASCLPPVCTSIQSKQELRGLPGGRA